MTNINWNGDAESAPFKSRFDDESGNLILAETDTGTALFEWDGTTWQFRGPVEMNGEDVSGIGSLTATSGDFDSVNAEEVNIDSGMIHVSNQAQFDQAVSNINEGGEIVLGPHDSYDEGETRTFENRISLRGVSHAGSEGSALRFDEWVFEGRGSSIQNVWANMDGVVEELVLDADNITVTNFHNWSGSGTIRVKSNNCILTGLNDVDEVVFESGTSRNFVGSSSNVSVTDNGTNTVGDIA